jgi:diaminopimelate decarboxylase
MKVVNASQLQNLAGEHGTPFYLYDWKVMAERVSNLRSFDVIRYAQKANSNTHILRRLREAGVVVDAVSLGEIQRALKAGFTATGEPSGIVFTADIVTDDCLAVVAEHHIPVNAGSLDMLDQVGKGTSKGHPVWLRINPGFGHGHSRKTNTGGEWSKHGIWHADTGAAVELIKRHELDLVGLHMHIGSGADFDHLRQVCAAMVTQVKTLGHDIRAISGGGGLPIPYRDEDAFDTSALFENWDRARNELQEHLGHPISLEIEPGRYLAAEAGVLVAEVRATKNMGENSFALVDAGFDNLVRPSMYGSYHHISLIRNGEPVTGDEHPWVIGGPLCESGDVFTQEEGGVVVPRPLPDPRVGDLVVFHDAGAYASTMASNYNSRPLAPELLDVDGEISVVRRRQTADDLLALEG